MMTKMVGLPGVEGAVQTPVKSAARGLTWLAACVLLMSAAGCITAAVTATVVYVASTMQYTATVEVKAKPADVYAAMLRVLKRRPDVEIVKRDDAAHLLDIRKGKNKATAQVSSTAGGLTLLKVTAQEGETEVTHEDLALRIVTQVCNELKVQYRVVEKKSPLKK
jgi:hypothetical protein